MAIATKTRQVFLILFMIAMLVNVALSGYIYYAKILGEQGLGSGGSCFANDGNIGSCLQVQLSSYSTILGVPLSIYGAAFFLLIFLFLLALFMESKAHWFGKTAKKYPAHVRAILIFLLIWGGAFSLWLIYIQVFLIGQLCKFCLWIDGITIGSAVIFLWLFSKQIFD